MSETPALDIQNTQRKLRETGYFLGLLENKVATRADPEEVLHLLSAFLSAGRSVTFVLQAEQKEAYRLWWPTWQDRLEPDERELLKVMNNQRVEELHRTGAAVGADVQYIPVTEIRTDERGHPAYGFHWYGPPGTPTPRIGRFDYFFNLGEAPEGVVQKCQDYYALLKRAVIEFLASVHTPTEDVASSV